MIFIKSSFACFNVLMYYAVLITGGTYRSLVTKIDVIFCVFTDVHGKMACMHAIIRNNKKYLVDTIQPDDELIASLLSLNCITEEQSHFIHRQSSTRDKNKELLKIMRCFDQRKFSNCIKCLRHTNQQKVARIIENGGGLKLTHYLTELLSLSQRISKTFGILLIYANP